MPVAVFLGLLHFAKPFSYPQEELKLLKKD